MTCQRNEIRLVIIWRRTKSNQIHPLCNVYKDWFLSYLSSVRLQTPKTKKCKKKSLCIIISVVDPDPDPVGSASFLPPGSVSMIWIRIAKNQSKSWETHIKIDKNSQNITFLKMEITLLLNVHKYKSFFFEHINFVGGKKFFGIFSILGRIRIRGLMRIHITNCNTIWLRY